MAKMADRKMDLSSAVKQLDGMLPSDVASLVHMTTSANGAGAFDENSMQKARKILNKMMLDAWADLDDVIFECKEFQERNRGTYEQVVADLARLGSQLSRLGELRVSSQQGIFLEFLAFKHDIIQLTPGMEHHVVQNLPCLLH